MIKVYAGYNPAIAAVRLPHEHLASGAAPVQAPGLASLECVCSPVQFVVRVSLHARDTACRFGSRRRA